MTEKNLVKKISNKQKMPHWFSLEIYKRDLSPKEWLDEIHFRILAKEIIDSKNTTEEKENVFIEVIVQKKIPGISRLIGHGKCEGIRPISVFEILSMADKIRESHWYSQLQNRNDLELAVHAFNGPNDLTMEEWKIFDQFQDVPAWAMLSSDPNIHTRGSFDIYAVINTSVTRDDLIKKFREIINSIVPKKKIRPVGNDIFETWRKNGVLPIFDLDLWTAIHSMKYTKNFLACILDDINPPLTKDEYIGEEFYVDEARRKIKTVINESTKTLLWNYCAQLGE